MILIALAGIFLFWLEPAKRIGDGSEYYLMMMAWAEKGQPFIDYEVDHRYEVYRSSRDFSFLSADQLQKYSNGLALESNRDLPHFWFYSLAAAPFYLFLNWVGTDIGYSFPLLHLVLLGGLFVVANKEFGRIGILVTLAIVFGSPVVWFVDKAHCEFATVVLLTMGVLFFQKQKIPNSIVCFCIAATQNPPFLIVAFLTGVIGLFVQRDSILRGWKKILLAIGIGIMHPIYYLIRHGNVTPQMITGAASSNSKGWKELTCFVIDPDVGLFSNWPWLLVPLCSVLILSIIHKQKPNWVTTVFVTSTLLFLCWAQSKTNNFNHGGTIKISRYSLWYIPFLFPNLHRFANHFSLVSNWQKVLAYIFLAVAFYVNGTKFNPLRQESYLYQTTIAEKFYDRFPSWYDPIPEIFIERCIRAELPTDAWAVSNRSGTKILVHRGRLRKQINRLNKGRPLEPVSGFQSPIQSESLVRFVQSKVKLPEEPIWIYVNNFQSQADDDELSIMKNR